MQHIAPLQLITAEPSNPLCVFHSFFLPRKMYGSIINSTDIVNSKVGKEQSIKHTSHTSEFRDCSTTLLQAFPYN